jgi:hypothetical protein
MPSLATPAFLHILHRQNMIMPLILATVVPVKMRHEKLAERGF